MPSKLLAIWLYVNPDHPLEPAVSLSWDKRAGAAAPGSVSVIDFGDTEATRSDAPRVLTSGNDAELMDWLKAAHTDQLCRGFVLRSTLGFAKEIPLGPAVIHDGLSRTDLLIRPAAGVVASGAVF